jgi:hypothetical protein
MPKGQVFRQTFFPTIFSVPSVKLQISTALCL